MGDHLLAQRLALLALGNILCALPGSPHALELQGGGALVLAGLSLRHVSA
jgi:hypothetical protein